jgi:hypothetical protein
MISTVAQIKAGKSQCGSRRVLVAISFHCARVTATQARTQGIRYYMDIGREKLTASSRLSGNSSHRVRVSASYPGLQAPGDALDQPDFVVRRRRFAEDRSKLRAQGRYWQGSGSDLCSRCR